MERRRLAAPLTRRDAKGDCHERRLGCDHSCYRDGNHRHRAYNRRRLARRSWRVALLPYRWHRAAGFSLVPIARPAPRRLDLCRAVHPDSDMGLLRIARERLGNGAVAGCPACDPHLDPARDADARAARGQALGGCMGRDRCCDNLCRGEFRHSGKAGDTSTTALPSQSHPALQIPRASPPALTGRPMAEPTPPGASRR